MLGLLPPFGYDATWNCLLFVCPFCRDVSLSSLSPWDRKHKFSLCEGWMFTFPLVCKHPLYSLSRPDSTHPSRWGGSCSSHLLPQLWPFSSLVPYLLPIFLEKKYKVPQCTNYMILFIKFSIVLTVARPHLNSTQLQTVMFSSITKHFRMLLGQVPVGSTTQNSTQ